MCRYFAEELGGSHVVIDSMMMVCASEEHLDEQKQFVTDLVRLSQETGLHVHLVTHCRKPQGGDESRRQLGPEVTLLRSGRGRTLAQKAQR